MNLVFVGLGGNTPGTTAAFSRIKGILGRLLIDARFSSLYRTAPQDDPDQADFWNAVAAGNWSGTAESLLERLLMLEAGEGRQRDFDRPKGPRVLDLDLLVFGEVVRGSPRITLPHPGLQNRRFALEPLIELKPHARNPHTGLLWADQLRLLPPQGVDRTDLPW